MKKGFLKTLHATAKLDALLLMSPRFLRTHLSVVLFLCCLSINAEIYYYDNHKLHLRFKIDTDTKEAQLGGGEPAVGNAFLLPPDGDSWWNTRENLWEELVIPETIVWDGNIYTVTSVACYAFYQIPELCRITLPKTIHSIGEYAFHDAINLESINIPETVTAIENSTFFNCRNLESIHIPSNVHSIGSCAFSDCYNLKEVNIPAACDIIGNDAFTWCESLSKVIIENGDKTLNLGYSFEHKNGYESGQGIEFDRYYRGLFSDCPLDTLYLGRNVKYPSLGKSPFGSFARIGIDDNGETIYLQTGKSFSLLEFGNGVTEIAGRLFYKAIINNPIEMPSRLNIIGKEAFYMASLKQTGMIFPETLDSIGLHAFSEELHFIECKSINPPRISAGSFANVNIVVTVPSGCGSKYRTHERWNKMRLIIDPSDEVVTINVKKPGSFYSRLIAQDIQLSEVFRLRLKGTINEEDIKILNTIPFLYDWDLSELIFEELPNNLFSNNRNKIVTIKLPNTLRKIRNQEFVGCSSLMNEMVIPASCTFIGDSAFVNVPITKLTCLGATNIGKKAFLNCNKLKNIVFAPETIVQEYAFETQHPTINPIITIDSVTFYSGTILEANAFHNSILKNIKFKDGVKKIGDDALGADFETLNFEGMVDSIGYISSDELSRIYVSNLETWCSLPFNGWGPMKKGICLFVEGEEVRDIVVPTTITTIRDGAFSFCSTLQNVHFHSQIKSIGSNAFYECSNLKRVIIPSLIKQISDGVFKNCVSLEEIVFPAKLTDIGSEAFSGCVKLSKVNLPANLYEVGNEAFKACSALEELEFPIGLKLIGGNAFSECSNLNKVMARWNDPIVINSNTFTGISNECYLYIPIMTASKYLSAGWTFPNVKETGVISITVNKGGIASYNEDIVRDSSEIFMFSPYKSFNVSIIPDEGYMIKKIRLNGMDAISLLKNGSLLIEEPEEDFILSVVFADNRILDGDVNGDGVIDKKDVINLMEHIVKKASNNFYDYASDLDGNDIIDIMDGLRLIHKVINENSKK